MTLLSLLAVFISGCGSRTSEPVTMKREKPLPTAPREIRVVTIGDSLAYGAGDEQGGGIAKRVKAELQTRGIAEVETTNLGVNGAQTADLKARLKQDRVRNALASADAIVLSIGANDLFKTPGAREETLRAPLAVAGRILGRVEEIVKEIRTINPSARILVLGGYNPVPSHPYAAMINQYLQLWDETLASRFEADGAVEVVRMFDLVDAQRLSRYDNFHPGGAAYAAVSERIAEILVQQKAA
jgi:lysophospholipase L1-like esterase